MKSKSEGFTVIELLVVLVFFGILVGIIGGSFGLAAGRSNRAEENLSVFLDEMNYSDVRGTTCSGSDSDQNGYVTCSVVFEDDSAESIECPYSVFSFANKTCKLPVVNFNRR